MFAKLLRHISPMFAAAPTVGGQAVMEGVMMRDRDHMAVAVRKQDGSIHVEAWPWFSFSHLKWMRRPILRGFPVLLETLINGIKALNFSASQAIDEEDGAEIKPWHLFLTLVVSIGMALGLFVVVPHLFSLGMQALGVGGNVEGLSFHIWDGFFKLAMFLGYIIAISFVPDIRRVFQYHGAEHKVVWSYEKRGRVDVAEARNESRLHPRCGTAFLLFVLSISIVAHAVLVPLILVIHSPENVVLKHAFILVVKLFLVAPISCLAYESIKFAGNHAGNLFCKLFNGPGLMLQMLTTKEPDDSQIEVAAAALEYAVSIERNHQEQTNYTDTLVDQTSTGRTVEEI